jgi:uncharacterized protein YjaG (DUF416 family)
MIHRDLERREILERVSALPQRHRAAYAAACAERLIPLYEWFQHEESWGDRTVLDKGIDLAWNWIATGQPRDADIADAIRACEGVTPHMDDFHTGVASSALDAASAVAQALEACISPLPETAADAGDIAWECAFGVEQSRVLRMDTVNIADWQLLQRAAKGGLVFLEEGLQRRSFEALQHLSLTSEEVTEFRRVFAHLSE